MKILDGGVLPGALVRVDVDPESDSMRFDRVEGKATEAPAAEVKAAASGASAGKSGRRK